MVTFLLPEPDDTWDEAFISAAFVSWHTEPSEDGSYIPMTEQEAQETFDRWLEEERAKAWDEGYETGGDDEAHYARGLSTDPGAEEVPHSNPYRKEKS